MQVRLKFIEVFNFKSFAGKNVIGPLLSFSAIVGANGSGKSNILEAICFVMGERARNLRVNKLQDLVHGAAMGQQCLESDPYAKAVFEEESGVEISFTRFIHGNSSIYEVNNSVVDAALYLDKLKDICIDIKSKNFLVQQGEVNSLMLASAKERSAFFERMSKSIECKDEYEKAEEKLKSAENNMRGLLIKRKLIFAEKRKTKAESDLTNQFLELTADLEENQLKFQLLQLKLVEIDRKQIMRGQDDLNEFFRGSVEELQNAEEQFRAKKKERDRLSYATFAAEELLKSLEKYATKKQDESIRLSEKTSHVLSKLDLLKSRLANAETVFERCKRTELELMGEIKSVHESKRSYIDHFDRELKAQGGHVQLDDDQIAEYRTLKEQAVKASGQHLTQLNSLEMQLKSDQAHLDNELRKMNDVQDRMKVTQQRLDFQTERLEKLNRFIDENRETLEILLTKESELESKLSTASARMAELNKEQQQIAEDLVEMADDKQTSGRYKKKMELINQLKRLFPGVFGRLIDFCIPSHNKYKIAVTKAIGSYFDAIICDCHVTAINCIRYMKDQRLEAETFLPLDHLKIKRVNERLRDERVTGVQNSKLAIDVLSLEDARIRPALLFVCGDCLICETVEDAQSVAHRLKEKTVSLDGVMFHKNGLISGGMSDLESQARRWNEKEFYQLKKRRNSIIDEQNQVQKTLREKSELLVTQSQIKGLRTRLKFATLDRDSVSDKESPEARKQLDDLQKELGCYDVTVADISGAISSLKEKIEVKKTEMDEIADGFFVQFCNRLGVQNVREYESKWLKLREEHHLKLLNFESHVMRLDNQLQFEKSRATEFMANVEKLQQQCKDGNEALERLRLEQEAHSQELSHCQEKRDDAKESMTLLKLQLDELNSDIDNFYRTHLNEKRDTFDSTRQALSASETRMVQINYERHAILKSFKFFNFSLPLIRGSPDDVFDESTEEEAIGLSMSSTNAPVIFERENRLQIDYSCLGTSYDMDDREKVKKQMEEMEDKITNLMVKLERLPHHDMAAKGRLLSVTSRHRDSMKEFSDARATVSSMKKEFDCVKKRRCALFTGFFNEVAEKINTVYKCLCEDLSAQAVLVIEKEEEPYLGGVSFNCSAPGKRFQNVENMSGGERILASLALLFTLCDSCHAPFLILDEIDASLDHTNIHRVVHYIQLQSKHLQCIAISHRKEFFGVAHALYGCYVKMTDEMSRTHLLTLNLQKYVRRPLMSSVLTPSLLDSSLA